MIYMIYLLTTVGLPPGGSSNVHIYTKTIHRTTQNKQYIEQHKNFGRVRAVPRLCGLYPGICLITEEKARKNLSQYDLSCVHRYKSRGFHCSVSNRKSATVTHTIQSLRDREQTSATLTL